MLGEGQDRRHFLPIKETGGKRYSFPSNDKVIGCDLKPCEVDAKDAIKAELGRFHSRCYIIGIKRDDLY
jgi:hypothetical protein